MCFCVASFRKLLGCEDHYFLHVFICFSFFWESTLNSPYPRSLLGDCIFLPVKTIQYEETPCCSYYCVRCSHKAREYERRTCFFDANFLGRNDPMKDGFMFVIFWGLKLRHNSHFLSLSQYKSSHRNLWQFLMGFCPTKRNGVSMMTLIFGFYWMI